MAHAVDLKAVEEAAHRIRSLAFETPVIRNSYVDELVGKQVLFKCEIFQKGGAFKFRGACNAVLSLPQEQAESGVITHSSGNHAGALALAAKARTIPCTVITPQGTPRCKLDAIRGYNARVIECEPTMDAREATCAAEQQRSGATFVPPYNAVPIIAGQGTIALEFLRQEPLDAIVVPVSGGGMISGIAVAAKAIQPDIQIYAAEPVGNNNAADVKAAKERGQLVPMARPNTIADGLQGRLGDLTWPIVRDLVEGVITISDMDILAAMRICFERMKVVVEPSGATGLAAVMSPAFRCLRHKRVGVILCGGNVDLDVLWPLIKAKIPV
ncbi:hypothetical protein WJX74_002327 [Apatococcus lobatus]|uniref:Serine racemase n=1 Tax=Apatococcus lobatus TaxID=904363 RepID=A0AAW1RHU7_9CHLO